jgi:hypothetical protein
MYEPSIGGTAAEPAWTVKIEDQPPSGAPGKACHPATLKAESSNRIETL